MKKYELQPTDKTTPLGKPLFQVVALRDFGEVLKGDKGGYVESEDNLAHKGNCWVSENARVYCNAEVSGNAMVFGEARVYGNSLVFGNAQVYNDAQVFGNARAYGNAQVYGEAWVYGNAQVFDNARVSGDVRVASGRAFATKNDHWDITEVSNGNGTSTLYADAVFEPVEPECDVHDGSEVSTTREVCDHADWTRGAYSDGIYVDMGYRYCPKCGEKLEENDR